MLNKHERDTETIEQPKNNVFQKVLLIWKYAKNFLSNSVQKNYQKCSFKVINHKSYKKRSLRQEILSHISISSSDICKICEKRIIQMNKCKELKTEEHEMNEHKYNKKNKTHRKKKDNKKTGGKKLPVCKEYNKKNAQIQWDECTRGKKRRNVKLCPRSSRCSVKTKKPKCICNGNFTKTTNKTDAPKKKNLKKNQKPRKINKKKQMYLKENTNHVNKFSSWRYMQHALSSVDEETNTDHDNEDSAPLYISFEEYCLILEAIDTQGTVELGENIEEFVERIDTKHIIGTEDVATNTDQPIENTEDASTNTEKLFKFTQQVNKTAEKTKTEQTNEITEELYRTTEIFTTVNSPLSGSSGVFVLNTDQSSESDIIHLKTNGAELTKDIEKLDQNSAKDFNEILNEQNEIRDDIAECSLESCNNEINQSEENVEAIEQTEESNDESNQSKEQTESPEDTLDNTQSQQNQTAENICSENQAEDADNFSEN